MKLTVVTNRKLCGERFEDRIEKIASARPDSIVLREKDLSPIEYVELAKRCSKICLRHGVRFMANSFWNVAYKNGFDRIQLPFSVFSDHSEVKNIFSEVGVSVHSVDEAVAAEKLGADRLTAGHIFATDCKKGIQPRGITFLSNICNAVNIPVHGIGGICFDNVGMIKDIGASGIYIMSELMKCHDPYERTAEYVEVLNRL